MFLRKYVTTNLLEMAVTLQRSRHRCNNNNNNFFNTVKSNRSTNNTYRPTSATQDSYTLKLGLGCHAGQPMVLDQRWAATDSGLGQPT